MIKYEKYLHKSGVNKSYEKQFNVKYLLPKCLIQGLVQTASHQTHVFAPRQVIVIVDVIVNRKFCLVQHSFAESVYNGYAYDR